MQWHPTAEKFPILEGKEWDDFKEDIRITKGNTKPIEYRLVKGKKQGLDGRNRFNACKELKLPCKEKLVNVPDEKVNTYIIRANILRRHQDSTSRQTLVSILRADGLSTRAIAETIDVPKSTVARDIAKTAEKSTKLSQSGTTYDEKPAENKQSPQKVTGTDGKSYSGKPSIFCDRCKRVGPVKDCQTCKDLRASKTAKKPEREAGDDTDSEAEAKKSAKKNGKVLFDWRPFNDGFGLLLRQVDKLGKAYKCKESKKAESLRQQLDDWRNEFKSWFTEVAHQKAPK